MFASIETQLEWLIRLKTDLNQLCTVFKYSLGLFFSFIPLRVFSLKRRKLYHLQNVEMNSKGTCKSFWLFAYFEQKIIA